jgi:anti-sigma regulatory factor (Ser/Thr protein kinase)
VGAGRSDAPRGPGPHAGLGEGRIVPGRVLPLDLRLLRRLRTMVREDLLGAGVDPSIVDDAVICVHEACANAMRHGKGRLYVHWETTETEISFGICDDGDGPRLPTQLPPPDQVSGRGLFLIGALAARLETRIHGSRQCLTFSFPGSLTAPSHSALPATAGEEAS